MVEHTPLPWRFLGTTAWKDQHGMPSSVCHVGNFTIVTNEDSYDFHESDEDDAAFIVRACNAHDELVAAMRKIADVMGDMMWPGYYAAEILRKLGLES